MLELQIAYGQGHTVCRADSQGHSGRTGFPPGRERGKSEGRRFEESAQVSWRAPVPGAIDRTRDGRTPRALSRLFETTPFALSPFPSRRESSAARMSLRISAADGVALTIRNL